MRILKTAFTALQTGVHRAHRRLFRLLKTVAWLFVLCTIPVYGQGKSPTVINGIFSSDLDLRVERTYPDGASDFGYGWQNFTSIRLRSAVNDLLSFYISVNLNAVSGVYTELFSAPFIADLERLYFKAHGDWIDVEAGLIRIARGYGYVFSPLDFLNTRDVLNSLDPTGRPPGKWGIHATIYPQDMWKIELFGLAPDNPTESKGWGSTFGAATNFSLGKINFDILYALLLPEVEYGSIPAPIEYPNDDFTQSAGFALKADIEIGFYVEALYRFEHRMFILDSYFGKVFHGYEGLEAAVGADYTFRGTDIYVLCEYLFYGPGYADWSDPSLDSIYTSGNWDDLTPEARMGMLDPAKKPLAFNRHDYLFLLAKQTPSDDLSYGVSALAGLDDLSALLTAFLEYEIVQGLTIRTSFLLPIDKRMFDSSAEAGEWGSTNLGFHALVRIGAKVKF
jgi:hypothetical protein